MNLFDVTVTYEGLPGKTVRVLAKVAADAIAKVSDDCQLIVPQSVTAKRIAHGKGQTAVIGRRILDK